MMKTLLSTLLAGILSTTVSVAEPIRVLFLGHESQHHNSNLYFPMLAEALGPDGIYFDYVTSVEEAFGDAKHLKRFDAVLIYANHGKIEPHQWENLYSYVRKGGGFVPVHCASWCFGNEPGFDKLVGGRFKSHQGAEFSPRTVKPDHDAIKGVPSLNAWDETYFHHNHNTKNRTVLQVRDAMPGDPHTEPEPWTWVRTEGKGRVFYTASGHDQRIWSKPEFHALLKQGILWSVGKKRLAQYETFIEKRPALTYEKRDNIPNYERRPEPLKYQHPLPPEVSMQYTRVPVGFRLELFAAEPDIVNPISMAWDERGRLWVAETVDYPNEIKSGRVGNDRIKILEDTNGDGRCDKVTIFADKLNIPTSITFAMGGLVVAHAPDFLLLTDVDGDDKADTRQLLISGWGVGDTHAGPSNLRYGFDNRVWGAVGYSAFRGTVGGKDHRFGSGVFRFERDLSAIQFIGQFNNNTWGLGFNEEGDVFGSTANRNPAFFCGIPDYIYEGSQRKMSAKMIADSAAFHPITPNIRQVDAFGQYTAGAGYVFATSPAFPPSWRNEMAFISGPTGNLLGQYRNLKKGSGYEAKNAFALVASADEWFSPVAAEVGPDGHLWIADWYNFIIQHNPTPSRGRGGYDARNGQGNAHINPNRDRQHGRIYRLIWEGAPKPNIKSLADASPSQLVAALGDDNLFWRLTAQRLLVESKPDAVVQSLRKNVLSGGYAAIHSLWSLHGMGKLDREIHQAALLSGNSALKKNAIKALDNSKEDVQLLFDTAVLTDNDPQVRREALVKLAEAPENDLVKQAATRLFAIKANRDDEWLSLLLNTAGGKHGIQRDMTLGQNIIGNNSFEEIKDGLPNGWKPRTYSNRGETSHTVSGPDKVKRTGKYALRIDSGKGADTSWFAPVKLERDTEYRLSAWIKTENVKGAMGALLNVHEIGKAGATKPIAKNSDWTQVESFFNSGSRTEATINLLFGGWGQSTGTAWYDDIQLQPVTYTERAVDTPKLEAGNAARGKTIFHEHPVASCVRCHRIGGEGGDVGPYLDGIALRKKEPYLRKSLMDPQAEMAEGYTAEVSPMPPIGILLKPQEVEDLVAFLLTLDTPPKPGTTQKRPTISFE